MDFVLIVVTLLLFGIGHAYVEACARLKGNAQ
jgi:hypothetical protein